MRIYLILALLVVFSSCVRNQKGQVLENTAPTNEKVFEVVEVVQASSYSYLRVKENFSEKWVAVTKQEFAVGDVYYYDTALEMPDFKSKDLDRTFDLVYFVNAISKTPMNQMPQNHVGAGAPAHSGKVESGKKSSVTMKKMDNEITVAQVFANRKDYSSKEFEIKGVVVKVNQAVMGKNWVHVQDGTDDAGNFDLTITTQDMAAIGEEVVFKGKLTLNKDFGAGYSYEVIMEDAVLVSSKAASKEL